MLSFRWSLTKASLFSMVMAGVIGGCGSYFSSDVPALLANLLQPLVRLWTSCLQLVILPLACSYLFVAIASPRDIERTSRAMLYSLLLFTLWLTVGTLVTVQLTPWFLRTYLAEYAGQGLGTSGIELDTVSTAATELSLSDWLVGLIPSNFLEAFSQGRMLSALIVTLLFAFAATRLHGEQRELIIRLAQAVADMAMSIVHWLLWLLPLMVFSIFLSVASHSGLEFIGPLGWYLVSLCLLLASFAALCYPLAVLVGGQPLRSFARAAVPVQVVAIGTRSSMACLQPMMDSATQILKLPMSTAELVIPLAVTLFRPNVVISSPFKLLFLAFVYGIDLETGQMLSFLIANVLLSFGSPGIPTRLVGVRFPMYVALGIPAEGVILLGAIDAVPDMFKTALNVTTSLSVATIISRWFGPVSAKAGHRLSPTKAEYAGELECSGGEAEAATSQTRLN